MSLLHSLINLACPLNPLLCLRWVFELLPNQDQERDLRRILFALAWASYPEKITQSLLRKSKEVVIFKRGKRESKNHRPALAENPISEDVLVSEELPDEEVFVAEYWVMFFDGSSRKREDRADKRKDSLSLSRSYYLNQ